MSNKNRNNIRLVSCWTDGSGSVTRYVYESERKRVYDFIVVKHFDNNKKWTLKVWKGDLNTTLKSWRTNIPVLPKPELFSIDRSIIDLVLIADDPAEVKRRASALRSTW